jgi:hypothetical protein
LRKKGISVSSDLTRYQRKQLKHLSDKGTVGYFKNGILYQREINPSSSSRKYA